ncbi:helix-turn-helix transcriptional regulator [Catenuloplanes sp. NPDC051500]|uniref:helix-turn-helix transcriptional regulator n=1 Tax=Catenuloplanes sp. NPDC051500 TaxID=3363959 RepID=UPI00379C0F0E
MAGRTVVCRVSGCVRWDVGAQHPSRWEVEESAMPPPVKNTVTTTDPELAHALLRDAYTDSHLQVSGDPTDFHLRHSRWNLGRVAIDELSNTLTIDMDLHPVETLWINRITRSTTEIEVGGVTRHYGTGDVFFAIPPSVGCRTRLAGSSLVTVGLDRELFAAVTGEETFDPMSRLRLEPMAADKARSWHRTVDFVTQTVLGNAEAVANPLVVGSAQRLLATIALHGYDTAPSETAGTRRDATPESVRRAVAFIEANPDLDVSVADIARAGYVSVRALQLAFRRHLDTTPLRYLRRVRLDLARTDLQAAQPGEGTTVTAVAMRWGYADLSRFAADYRAAYGEHPHVTLRRAGAL